MIIITNTVMMICLSSPLLNNMIPPQESIIASKTDYFHLCWPLFIRGSDAINGSEVIHQAALLLNFFLIHRTVRALKLFHFLSDMDITKFQKKILLFFAVNDSTQIMDGEPSVTSNYARRLISTIKENKESFRISEGVNF